MKRFALVFLALVCFAQEHVLKKGIPKHVPPFSGFLDLTAANWSEIAVGTLPLSNINGTLVFNFPYFDPFMPGIDQGSINYLTTAISADISADSAMSVTFQSVTQGAPYFQWNMEPGNNCIFNCLTATMRLLIIGPNFDRWFSTDCVSLLPSDGVLAHCTFLQPGGTFTVSLVESNWTPVTNGTFAFDLSHVTALGVCFGGGFFDCHGVNISGPSGSVAQLVISSLMVQ